MGAINYYTSDYITLAIEPYNINDFYNDPEFMQQAQEESNLYDNSIKNIIDSYIEEYYNCDYENIKAILNKYQLYYFHIKIQPGYYEGFSLDIENNYPLCYDFYEQRREANKEITQIKKLLIECAEYGLKLCHPGWVTTFYSYQETLEAINKAVQTMRDDVKTTPTWRQYERS